MDGTIANLYGVQNWLDYILNDDEFPYVNAAPLVNLQALARRLNNLQKEGYRIGVISWLAKNSKPAYDEKVTRAKKEWLKKHLKSVCFDEIHIISYGTPKSTVTNNKHCILFDDEAPNLSEWIENCGKAFYPSEIFAVLTKLRKAGV
jgi:hypothetical protein